jgi:hypothetical protein
LVNNLVKVSCILLVNNLLRVLTGFRLITGKSIIKTSEFSFISHYFKYSDQFNSAKESENRKSKCRAETDMSVNDILQNGLCCFQRITGLTSILFFVGSKKSVFAKPGDYVMVADAVLSHTVSSVVPLMRIRLIGLLLVKKSNNSLFSSHFITLQKFFYDTQTYNYK